MIWRKRIFGEEVRAEYALPYVGNREIERKGTFANKKSLLHTTITIYSTSVGRAESEAVRSLAFLRIGWRNDGEQGTSIDQPPMPFVTIDYVKQ